MATVATAALAVPASAEQSRSVGAQPMVAQQQRAIGSAISMWEYLQENRNLPFAQYAGFAVANPTFPRLDIIRLRAEAALENEAPPTDELLRFFGAHPPLTNAGRARYALTLAAAQHAGAFEVARDAWRGGRMSGPAEAYIAGLYGSRFSDDDHAARMDSLLWQGEREAAARQVINLRESDRPLAMARLSLLNGSTPREAGLAIPNAANRDAGFTFNLLNYLWAKRQVGEAVRLLATRPAFEAPARDPEEFLGDMLAVAKAASATDTVDITSRIDDIFAPGADISQGSFRLRDRYTDLMWMGAPMPCGGLATDAAPPRCSNVTAMRHARR
ncbi:hypothetical protein [Erythrobacter sp. JK5]|uniref:hypothetical protein n=1 Tax=Erythrobacter sp. JK5 TaxID=2829500 RepID=UPI00201392CF|nr:hypothetical protein [Erythrobacter sp. JK5]